MSSLWTRSDLAKDSNNKYTDTHTQQAITCLWLSLGAREDVCFLDGGAIWIHKTASYRNCWAENRKIAQTDLTMKMLNK